VALGHASLIAIDDRMSAAELLRHVWRFAASESCGTCAAKGSNMNEIVVGLDLSPSGRPALGWAAEHARRTGQTVGVGTREDVGTGRLLFGSVSHYCLSHAHCPVVAVPAEGDQSAHQDHDQAAADTPAHA
jgi:hypothetical protein